MSAVNILVQRDAVHLLTDGARYNLPDVTYQGTMIKVVPIPHLNCAVGCRGPALAVPIVASVLAAAGSYEALRSDIYEFMRKAADILSRVTQRPDDSFEVYVVGWADGRPDAFAVLPSNVFGPRAISTRLPWAVLPIAESYFAPDGEVGGALDRDIQGIVTGRSVDDLDARTDGLALLEAQRRHKSVVPTGESEFAVGGFAQLMTVRPSSVTTEILRTWPDVPGEKIDPLRLCCHRPYGEHGLQSYESASAVAPGHLQAEAATAANFIAGANNSSPANGEVQLCSMAINVVSGKVLIDGQFVIVGPSSNIGVQTAAITIKIDGSVHRTRTIEPVLIQFAASENFYRLLGIQTITSLAVLSAGVHTISLWGSSSYSFAVGFNEPILRTLESRR